MFEIVGIDAREIQRSIADPTSRVFGGSATRSTSSPRSSKRSYTRTEGDLGSIVKRKITDLVVLRADPCDDIRNTTGIESVIRDGVLVWRNRAR
jgi:hypothetical protein